MVPLAVLLTAAAVCCLPLQHAAAATLYEIDPWVIPPSNITYPPLATACPGDQIRFVWSSGNHGVFKLFNNATDTAGTCPANWSASTGVELAPLAGSGNITYTVQQQDGPSFWLACQNGQGRHCQRGQKLLVQVMCGAGAGAPAAEAPAAEAPAAEAPAAEAPAAEAPAAEAPAAEAPAAQAPAAAVPAGMRGAGGA
uniref:Phytocyanin domain-containing protein n=1 Tax=Tetradesmus obliquus TaxID=3088 RepID=A0A383V7N1_TETOB|eukprot:jgi/Sobl393_1/13640/SZX60356.1